MADFTVREYAAGDEVAINEGYNRALGRRRPLTEWWWKFPDSPEGRWIMIAKGEDAGLLAHFAAVPVRMQVGSLQIRAGQITDGFSLPGANRHLEVGRVYTQTVDAFLLRFGVPDGLALLYLFPSERDLRPAVPNPRFTEMSPQPVGYWVRSARRRHELSTGHEIRQGVDLRAADELWRRASGRYEMALVRNGTWLRRRFTGRPGVEYLQLSAWREGRAHAWAVVCAQRAVTMWADLVWDGEDPGALAALDRAIVAGSAAVQAGRLEMWLMGDQAAAEALRRLGWELHVHPEKLALVAWSFHPDIDANRYRDRLYVTMGDSDRV